MVYGFWPSEPQNININDNVWAILAWNVYENGRQYNTKDKLKKSIKEACIFCYWKKSAAKILYATGIARQKVPIQKKIYNLISIPNRQIIMETLLRRVSHIDQRAINFSAWTNFYFYSHKNFDSSALLVMGFIWEKRKKCDEIKSSKNIFLNEYDSI